MTDPTIRPLREGDVAALVAAFSALGWPGKDDSQFSEYLADAARGSHVWLVAFVGDEPAGYGGLEWASRYPPFVAAGIPEVVDLNVLPPWRRQGIAARLMDELEGLAATRSRTVGLGVGLYADYAAAWRLYLGRGYLPDGAGLVYQGAAVAPGQVVRLDDDAEIKLTRNLG